MKDSYRKRIKLIIPFVLIGIVIAIIFGAKLLQEAGKKKEELIIQPEVVMPVSTPPPEVVQAEKEKSVLEKIEELKKELQENPTDVAKMEQLAQAYIEAGYIASALLEYKNIISTSPTSQEAKNAMEWIRKQEEIAFSDWKNNVSKKFQEPALLLEYGGLTTYLAPISEKVKPKELTPIHGLSPAVGTVPQGIIPYQTGQVGPNYVGHITPYVITYPPVAMQYYPYLQQYYTPVAIPQAQQPYPYPTR